MEEFGIDLILFEEFAEFAPLLARCQGGMTYISLALAHQSDKVVPLKGFNRLLFQRLKCLRAWSASRRRLLEVLQPVATQILSLNRVGLAKPNSANDGALELSDVA